MIVTDLESVGVATTDKIKTWCGKSSEEQTKINNEFLAATEVGDLVEVEGLIEEGANINWQNEDGWEINTDKTYYILGIE